MFRWSSIIIIAIPLEESETIYILLLMRSSRFVPKLKKRKALEKELKELKMSVPPAKPVMKSRVEHEFKTYVRTGDRLRHFAAPVR